jgi:RNA polymerase sigma factor (sigma-70 family)
MEGSPASDAELIDASRRGERAAFGALVERYANMVEAVSYAGTRDRTLGQDIAQDTFVAAWRDLDRLRDTTAVKPWLCGIARNLARKARRRRGREVAAPEPDAVVERTPFDVLREGQAEQLVAAALARVPDVYREALVLFYYEQRSTRDVADALGITEEAVHKRLSRGRSFLAAGLEESVERALENKRSRRNLAAVVLGALPVTLAVAPSHADAATKGSSMWKIGALGIAATTVAVGTVVAWPRSDAKVSTDRTASNSPTGRDQVVAARTGVPQATSPTLPAPSPAHRTARVEGGADCSAVARHMVDIAVAEIPMPSNMKPQDTEWTARLVTSQFEQVCRDAQWSPTTIGCVLAADDMWNAMLCKGAQTMASPPPLAPPGTDIGCPAVAAHAVEITTASIASQVPPEQRAVIDAQRPRMTKMIEQTCTTGAWSETQRRCAAAATSPVALGFCTRDAGPSPTPAPPGADASCAAVGKHVAALLSQPLSESDMPGVPADLRAALTSSDGVVPAQVETACTNGAWPDSMRRCLIGATQPQQVSACQM